MSDPHSPREIDHAIRRLALPSLATLIVEPLLVAVDTTMVGWLGTNPLAGLALASTIVMTIVGVCVFLSFATTAATARAVGSNRHTQALRHGIDALWIAAVLGAAITTTLELAASPILSWFHPTAAVHTQALQYIQACAWGVPAMLIVYAATGTLRGFADTRTPLIGVTIAASVNVPLNALFIYVFHCGISGAGYGTAIAQSLMAFLLCRAIIRLRNLHAPKLSLMPTGAGVLRSVRAAIPLIIRTLCLRGALMLHISAATALGTTALAANQIVMTVWNFSAFGLDAIATAAQILVGQNLGSGQYQRVHGILHRCMRYALRTGIILGIVLIGGSLVIPSIMTNDPAVSWLATRTMWVTSATLPIAALAFMLDGVLMGAGDTRPLAGYMLAALAVFTPIALLFIGPARSWASAGLLWLWMGYAVVFMGIRALTMIYRVHGTQWMHPENNQLT
ncbi:MATE family efflux transporter [Trueperella sp. LYQ143]|uniref:MATE family efflux transporter n=1 Tax=Trueperella sp. LYQ143 TaxID=3391059 RepID=UPI003982FBD0